MKLLAVITVDDFAIDVQKVPSPQAIGDLEHDMASDIGIRLANLGDSWHGQVQVEFVEG